MTTEMEKAREAAIQQIKADAQKYNERHINRPLTVPSVEVDDFSVRLGFDAGVKAAQPQWVRIRSVKDLPKESGHYPVWDDERDRPAVEWFDAEQGAYQRNWVNQGYIYLPCLIPHFTDDNTPTSTEVDNAPNN